MPRHPVPFRAASAVLAGRCFDLQSAYFLCFIIRNRLILWILFWLHQGRIPRHTCRFYCCLAAHQRTRKKDSAEPSFPILWTPPHPPGESAAAGHICCRGFIPIQVTVFRCKSLIPSSECCAAICVRAGIVRVSVGLLGFGRTFFIIGGMDCTFLRLRVVLLWSIVGFALTAIGSFLWADNVTG